MDAFFEAVGAYGVMTRCCSPLQTRTVASLVSETELSWQSMAYAFARRRCPVPEDFPRRFTGRTTINVLRASLWYSDSRTDVKLQRIHPVSPPLS